jgi:MFS transporter, CP family, cyanate transporter
MQNPTIKIPPAIVMLARAVEGVGFVLVVLAAPPLIRRHVPPEQLQMALGSWGAFMPAGNALALLIGPWVTVGACGVGSVLALMLGTSKSH